MRWLSWGLLEEISPLGLLVAGVAFGASTPFLRKGIRKFAVLTAKGILTGIEQAKKIESKTEESWREFLTETRNQKEKKGLAAKEQLRSAAVSVIKKGLNIADAASHSVTEIKKELHELVSEARDTREEDEKDKQTPDNTKGAEKIEGDHSSTLESGKQAVPENKNSDDGGL